MIEKSTLESLNYFIDEDIQNCKDAMKEFEGFDNLQAYYNGQINGLEYAKHLINQQWKSDQQIEKEPRNEKITFSAGKSYDFWNSKEDSIYDEE